MQLGCSHLCDNFGLLRFERINFLSEDQHGRNISMLLQHRTTRTDATHRKNLCFCMLQLCDLHVLSEYISGERILLRNSF